MCLTMQRLEILCLVNAQVYSTLLGGVRIEYLFKVNGEIVENGI